MPKVTLLYFAGVKDITSKESEVLDIPGENSTLDDLSQYLIAAYGDKLKEILSASMYAVNMEYIEKQDESTTVIDGSHEVAIIPPVSGG